MKTRLPGYCDKGVPVPRVLCHSLAEVTGVPGKGTGILQNLPKFRVRVRKCCRTHRRSGYGGTGVHNSQKFRAGIKLRYPYPGCLWHGLTELTEVPGTGMNVVQNYRSSGYRYDCPTELSEVLCRLVPRVNTPGMVLYVPYRTQPGETVWYCVLRCSGSERKR